MPVELRNMLLLLLTMPPEPEELVLVRVARGARAAMLCSLSSPGLQAACGLGAYSGMEVLWTLEKKPGTPEVVEAVPPAALLASARLLTPPWDRRRGMEKARLKGLLLLLAAEVLGPSSGLGQFTEKLRPLLREAGSTPCPMSARW